MNNHSRARSLLSTYYGPDFGLGASILYFIDSSCRPSMMGVKCPSPPLFFTEDEQRSSNLPQGQTARQWLTRELNLRFCGSEAQGRSACCGTCDTFCHSRLSHSHNIICLFGVVQILKIYVDRVL